MDSNSILQSVKDAENKAKEEIISRIYARLNTYLEHPFFKYLTELKEDMDFNAVYPIRFFMSIGDEYNKTCCYWFAKFETNNFVLISDVDNDSANSKLELLRKPLKGLLYLEDAISPYDKDKSGENISPAQFNNRLEYIHGLNKHYPIGCIVKNRVFNHYYIIKSKYVLSYCTGYKCLAKCINTGKTENIDFSNVLETSLTLEDVKNILIGKLDKQIAEYQENIKNIEKEKQMVINNILSCD